jgi:hypothetical protein
MAVYPNYYPLGGSNQNGKYRSATTQTSSSTTVGTGTGNVGTNVTSVNVAPGATYIPATGGAGSSGLTWVNLTTCSYPVPDPPKDMGIKAGEFTGYRAWYFHSMPHPINLDDLRLHSVFAMHLWHPGTSEKSNRDVDDCLVGSGFHAFKEPRQCLREYGVLPIVDMGAIFGEVKLWGKVIEHEMGFRAEYCKITKLSDILIHPYYGLDHDDVLNHFCKTYAVERGQAWRIMQPEMRPSIGWQQAQAVTPASPPVVVNSKSWTGLGW